MLVIEEVAKDGESADADQPVPDFVDVLFVVEPVGLFSGLLLVCHVFLRVSP